MYTGSVRTGRFRGTICTGGNSRKVLRRNVWSACGATHGALALLPAWRQRPLPPRPRRHPPYRGGEGEGGGDWGIKEISLRLTGCVCAQWATCRASSFATGIGLRSIAASCWQPRAQSLKRHWRLMRAAARPLRARTLHLPIGPGQSPSPFFRVTALTVAKGHCQGPGTIPGSGSRHSFLIARAMRFSTPSIPLQIRPGRAGWSGRSTAIETWRMGT